MTGVTVHQDYPDHPRRPARASEDLEQATVTSVTTRHKLSSRSDQTAIAFRLTNAGKLADVIAWFLVGRNGTVGHIHLGTLPNSVRWRDLVASMDRGDPDAAVFAATAHAIERELAGAVNEPVLVEAVRLLAMIPQAARADSFGAALRDLGLQVGNAPDLLEVVTAVGERLDVVATDGPRRTDFGELGRRAMTATLSRAIADRLPGLFEATPADVRLAIGAFGSSAGFQGTARTLFARLLADTMRSWLDRTSSAQVGPNRRFTDGGRRTAFDAALTQYTYEATRIIREFSAGWHAKTLHREGRIERRHAASFCDIALRKIGEELRAKRGTGD